MNKLIIEKFIIELSHRFLIECIEQWFDEWWYWRCHYENEHCYWHLLRNNPYVLIKMMSFREIIEGVIYLFIWFRYSFRYGSVFYETRDKNSVEILIYDLLILINTLSVLFPFIIDIKKHYSNIFRNRYVNIAVLLPKAVTDIYANPTSTTELP
jgi:hypothetical protein